MTRTRRTCTELGACQGRPGPGCTCQHDTDALPPGGFYFAPGAIEHGPRRKPKRLAPWQRLVLQAMAVLLASGLVGMVAGVLQAKGWPL